MAEYCLTCFNRMNQTNYKKDVWIDDEEMSLCEGCGEYKPCIIALQKKNGRRRLAEIRKGNYNFKGIGYPGK